MKKKTSQLPKQLKAEKLRKFRLPRAPRVKEPIYKKGFSVGRFDLLNREDWKILEPSTGPIGRHPNLVGASPASKGGNSRINVVNTRSTVRIIARYYKGFRRGTSWGQRPGSRVATDGARIQSVVKSRYQTNRWNIAKDKLMKHLSYLEFRPRADFEKARDRRFYTRDRSDISGVRVFEEAKDKMGYRAGYHKIILSPGDNSINLTDYTRQVMEQWQKSVGREFSWWAVNHYNTDHYHSHVVVAGKDRKDRDVELDREMLAECREISDRYLCRDRNFDRELDRIADIKTDQMMRGFDMVDKLLDLGIGRPEQLQQILDLGLKTDGDYRKEWEALGLRKIYELGRPFEGIRQVSKEQAELERDERIREGLEAPTFNQVFGADFGPGEAKDYHDGDREEGEAGEVSQEYEGDGGEPQQDVSEGIGNENLSGKTESDSGQTQPGGWLQQQNTVIAEPASVPFGHDVKEQENSSRDDDDGMRITAKGRI